THTCLGQISNMGGIPSPVITAEGRMVWRLQFACLFGG
ncbi:phage tail termination protein, partial [Klebsiella pneumoniae]